MQEKLLLTVPEVAKLLGIGRNTAYELIYRRGFPVIRFGRAVRIPRQALLEWITEEAKRK
ncbi:MAG: helix-turn-helix domain-containing protein [Candidatus Methanomethyliaceae archaeon]